MSAINVDDYRNQARKQIHNYAILLSCLLKKNESIAINDCGCYGIVSGIGGKPQFTYCSRHEKIRK